MALTYDTLGSTYDDPTVTYDGGGVAPIVAGTSLYELNEAIVVKAGLGADKGATYAANVLAGVTGFSLVGALNILAGNPKSQWRDLAGVLNQLAGTTDMSAQGAANRWAGRW